MKNLLLPIFTVLPFMVFAQNPVPECAIGDFYFTGNAADSSGLGNHGAAYSATLTAGRDSIQNTAYQFNGVDSRIEVNGNQPIIETVEFSITSWARMDARGGGIHNNNPIFLQRAFSTGNTCAIGFHAENGGGYTFLAVRTLGGQTQLISAPSPGYGTWNHFAAVSDGDSLRLYINGSLVVTEPFFTGTGIVDQDISTVEIGRQNYQSTTTGAFNGAIDQVNIYNCALTSSEISNMAGGPVSSLKEIAESKVVNDILIYPNPTNNFVTLDMDNEFSYMVFDQAGRMILSGNDTKLDLTSYESGMYMIQFMDKNGYLVDFKKILKF